MTKIDELFQAIKNNNLDMVKESIENGEVDIESRNSNWLTPLLFAVYNNNIDITKYLVEAGANVQATSKSECTVLMFAVIFADPELVDYLLDQADISVEAVEREGNSALIFATNRCNITVKCGGIYQTMIAEYAKFDRNLLWTEDDIDNGPDIDSKNKTMDIVKLLVEKGSANLELENLSSSYLLRAAAEGRILEVFTYLVEKGAQIKQTYGNSNIVLHGIAAGGNIDILKFVLERYNVDINAIVDSEFFHCNMLCIAALHGQLKMVKYLIEELKINVDQHENGAYTVTSAAAAATVGSVRILKYLVEEQKINLYEKNNKGENALFEAVKNEDISVTKYLVEDCEMSLDATNTNGESILFTAMEENRNIDIIRYLIDEKHMDINAVDEDGNNILFKACSYGNFAIVKYLIDEKKMNINAINKCGENILFKAFFSFADLNTIKYLIDEKHMDINAKNQGGENVLFYAIRSGNIKKIEYLIKEKGMDINTKNNEGENILFQAAWSSYDTNIIQYLTKEKGMDINAKNNREENILFVAAARNALTIIKYCVDVAHMEINAKNKYGQNILFKAVAQNRNNMDVIKYLVEEKGININENDSTGCNIIVMMHGENEKLLKYAIINGLQITDLNHKFDFISRHKEQNPNTILTKIVEYITADNVDLDNEDFNPECYMIAMLNKMTRLTSRKEIKDFVLNNEFLQSVLFKGTDLNQTLLIFDGDWREFFLKCREQSIDLSAIIDDEDLPFLIHYDAILYGVDWENVDDIDLQQKFVKLLFAHPNLLENWEVREILESQTENIVSIRKMHLDLVGYTNYDDGLKILLLEMNNDLWEERHHMYKETRYFDTREDYFFTSDMANVSNFWHLQSSAYALPATLDGHLIVAPLECTQNANAMRLIYQSQAQEQHGKKLHMNAIMHTAIATRDVDIIKILLTSGFDVPQHTDFKSFFTPQQIEFFGYRNKIAHLCIDHKFEQAHELALKVDAEDFCTIMTEHYGKLICDATPLINGNASLLANDLQYDNL